MMDRCRDIEQELTAYGSGELGTAERELIRVHLEDCASCRAELDRELSLRDILGSLPAARAPRDLDSRIQASVRSTGTTTKPHWNRKRLTASVALAAAGLAVVLLLPGLRPAADPEPAWSAEEMAAARQDVVFTLALTAKVINRTRKDTVVEVFADRLPNAINESFKKVKLTTSGGNG